MTTNPMQGALAGLWREGKGGAFWAALASQLEWTPSAKYDRLATDGVRAFYNPEWTPTQRARQLVYGMAHEAAHPALDHLRRRGQWSKEHWNAAADCAVASVIEGVGERLDDIITPDTYGLPWDHTAEWYANHIPEKPEPEPEPEPDDGDQGDSGEPCPGGDLIDPQGSAEDGGQTAAETAAAAQQWRQAVAEAAEAAGEAPGTMPGNLAAWVGDVLEPPQVSWLDELRPFMLDKIKSRKTWKRPSRRHMARGLYLPSRSAGKTLKKLGVFIDVSYSVDIPKVMAAIAEVQGIAQSLPMIGVTVAQWDTEVREELTREYVAADVPFNVEIGRGGGTAVQCVFDWLEAATTEYKAALIITDGEINDYPPEPGRVPILWAFTAKEGGYPRPTWGAQVELT